jgi:hypothetical protein
MPSLRGAAVGAQGLQGQAVAEQQVVRHLQARVRLFRPGAKDAVLVAQHGNHPGFVVRGWMLAQWLPKRRATPRA